jgi:hypothetical protein
MPDFSGSISVDAPASAILEYVSDPANMPKYLPTVQEAWKVGDDGVGMRVKLGDKIHEDEGYLRVPSESRMEWGSEDKDYHGSLDVAGEGDQSEVTLSLRINPPPQQDGEMKENSDGDWMSRIQASLEEALRSIKTEIEGA